MAYGPSTPLPAKLPSLARDGIAISPGNSAYPHLWKDLLRLFCPSVGRMSQTSILDWSGQGGHGTLNGSMNADDWQIATDGLYRGNLALDFDGSDDNLQCTSKQISAVSFLAWVYLTGGPSSTGRFCEWNGSHIFPMQYFHSGGSGLNAKSIGLSAIFSTASGHWCTPTNSIAFDTWYHIASTYSYTDTNEDPALWINGVRQTVTEATTPIGTVPSYTSNPCYIGGNASSTRQIQGMMDDIRIYERRLSDVEIWESYLGASPLTLLKPYWGKASVVTGHISNIPKGTITATLQTPSTVTTNKHISNIPVKTLAITGQTPSTVTTNKHISNIPVKTLAIAGQTPSTVTTNKHISNISAGSITATSQTPTIIVTTVAGNASNIPVGSITATPQTPTTVTTNKHISTIPVATLDLASQTPTTTTTNNHIIGMPVKTLALSSPNIITISGSAAAAEIADAVWNAQLSDYNIPGTFGAQVQKLLTLAKFLGLQ